SSSLQGRRWNSKGALDVDPHKSEHKNRQRKMRSQRTGKNGEANMALKCSGEESSGSRSRKLEDKGCVSVRISKSWALYIDIEIRTQHGLEVQRPNDIKHSILICLGAQIRFRLDTKSW